MRDSRRSVTLQDSASLVGSPEQKIALSRNDRAQGLISAASVGPVNRGRLLQALFDRGPSSRADLARFTGVTRGTIGGIVQPLIEQRILEEGEVIPPDYAGGKPAVKMWFARDAKPICAVFLTHSSVRTCLVSLSGDISARNELRLPPHVTNATEAITIVRKCIERTLASAPKSVLGIGIAAAGMINTETGTLNTVNLAPYFAGYPMKAELSRMFGVPVCVDQDARALLVGDRWFGLGRGLNKFRGGLYGRGLGRGSVLERASLPRSSRSRWRSGSHYGPTWRQIM